MALRNKSLFLYGFTVDSSNNSLDFAINGGSTRLGTLKYGYYTLNSLMTEVKRALEEQAAGFTFDYEIDRSIAGGLQNRVKISISSGTLTLRFGSGPRKSSSCASLIGFNPLNVTGAELWSNFTAGTTLLSEREGYTYLSPDLMRRVRGSVNISASGIKESIVYEVQQFSQVEFRYEPEAKAQTQWRALFDWMIQQRPIELTPDYTLSSEVIEATLEKTSADQNGLAYTLTEMLPDFPFFYRTGLITFRKSTGPFAVLTPQGISGGGGGGGGGAATISSQTASSWYAGPDYPPLEAEENNQFVYLFSPAAGQKLVLEARIPQDYVTGAQIFAYLSFYSQSASGTMKLQTTTYLVRAGLDSVGSTANAHASTNPIVTNTSSFMLRTQAIDLSSASGTINGLNPSPGDLIRIELTRGVDTDANAIRLIPSATVITFG